MDIDPNAALQVMRIMARRARQADDVRRSERELRWAFETLDEGLTGGKLPLPDDWRPRPATGVTPPPGTGYKSLCCGKIQGDPHESWCPDREEKPQHE